jgi:hypothetical protein
VHHPCNVGAASCKKQKEKTEEMEADQREKDERGQIKGEKVLTAAAIKP